MSLEDSGMLALPDLRLLQLQQVPLLMRFQRTDLAGNVYTDECTFYISNTNDSSVFDGVCSFNVSLKGTGGITQIFTSTSSNPGTVVRVDYIGIGGETTIVNPALIGKQLIEFEKDGKGFGPIILSGTPINSEVKFTSSTGTIEIGIPFDPNEPSYYLYQ